MTAPVLQADDLSKTYQLSTGLGRHHRLQALEGVGFQLLKQQTLAIVGESGCGKSTLARLLTAIETPSRGRIELHGNPLDKIEKRLYRQKVQMIFQDPYGSLNPRKKAIEIIAEPLYINTEKSRSECRQLAMEMMQKVGLRPEYASRYPHMFSGGQRQRIGIARALIMQPEVVICDEPVSALDISIQAQVLNLLLELQESFDLSYIFISHDLAVVQHIADEVLVMYLGKVVESGNREQIFSQAKHPYTQGLLASTPQIHAEDRQQEISIGGDLPSPLHPPTGCAFHTRCPLAEARCRQEVPPLRPHSDNHLVACHLVP